MKKFFLPLLLLAATAFADGPVQNQQIMGVNDVESSVATATGNLAIGSACASSLSFSAGAYSDLFVGAYVYDHTNSGYLPTLTTVAGLPGTCSSGQVQLSNVSSSNATGDTLWFGGLPATGVPNSAKIWDTNLGETIAAALANGDIATATSSSNQLNNLGLSASVASNALTVALKQKDGSTDPSTGTAAVTIGFRNATATTGAYAVSSVTSALSITIPSGATLGQANAPSYTYVWVYALMDSSVDLCVSGIQLFPQTAPQNSTQISSGATSGTTLYCASSHTGAKPVRIIGRLAVSETTAGTWASGPTEVAINPPVSQDGVVISTQTAGHTGIVTLEFASGLGEGNCTSSPCLLDTYTGGVSSITRSATGSYAVHFTAGVFSGNPICTCSSIAEGVIVTSCSPTGTESPTTWSFETHNAGTATDSAFTIICVAQH